MIPESKCSFRCVSCFAVGCFVLRPISCCPCDLYVYVIVCPSRRVCVLRMMRVPVPNRTFIGSQVRRISVSCAPLSTLWVPWINYYYSTTLPPHWAVNDTVPILLFELALTMFHLMSLLLVNANWRFRFDIASTIKYLSSLFYCFPNNNSHAHNAFFAFLSIVFYKCCSVESLEQPYIVRLLHLILKTVQKHSINLTKPTCSKEYGSLF